MSNYHIEVHSRDRQIEHYLCPDCDSEEHACKLMDEFYKEKNQVLGKSLEELRSDIRLHYYIFRVEELEDKPVIYISGE